MNIEHSVGFMTISIFDIEIRKRFFFLPLLRCHRVELNTENKKNQRSNFVSSRNMDDMTFESSIKQRNLCLTLRMFLWCRWSIFNLHPSCLNTKLWNEFKKCWFGFSFCWSARLRLRKDFCFLITKHLWVTSSDVRG